MGFIRGIIGLAFAVLFAIFAVANRQDVEIVWHPVLPPVHAPLYVVALGLLALGFVLGGIMGWLNSVPVRWQKSRQARKIKKLEKQLGAVKETKVPETPIIQPVTDWVPPPVLDKPPGQP
ncbi:MAG: LapA family protein [Alphaproteobacteria bacterium]